MKALNQGYLATFKGVIMNQAVLNLFSGKEKASPKQTVKSLCVGSLFEAELNKEYVIKDVISDDKEIVNFLFTLGCFKGEEVTVVSILSDTFVISIKDARYSIDADLAQTVKLM